VDEGSPRQFVVRPRVLVVDDEELVRLVIARQLRLSGFDVFEARDGLEALARLPVAAPDIVLTDLNMPRCNGEMLCAEIKRRHATANVPVVLMTGGPLDETHMREIGCAAVLYKPLVDRLDEFLLSILEDVAPASRPGAWAAPAKGPARQPPAA
jgi:CheY-like chemotaxis protein